MDRDGGDRRIQYRSLDQMEHLKLRMEKDLGIVPNRPAQRLAQPSKGL